VRKSRYSDEQIAAALRRPKPARPSPRSSASSASPRRRSTRGKNASDRLGRRKFVNCASCARRTRGSSASLQDLTLDRQVLQDARIWRAPTCALRISCCSTTPGSSRNRSCARSVNRPIDTRRTYAIATPPQGNAPSVELPIIVRLDGRSLRAALAQYNVVFRSTLLIRRALALGVGGFQAKLRIAEDWDLLLRLAQRDVTAIAIEAPLVRYRVHGDDSSADFAPQSGSSRRACASCRAPRSRSGSSCPSRWTTRPAGRSATRRAR
jgi:hypothetical protein